MKNIAFVSENRKLKIWIILILCHATILFGQVSLKNISIENGKDNFGFRHSPVSYNTGTYNRVFDRTAQNNFTIKNFSTENGMPHNSVLSIAQDQTGFLWIGTWDGLARFDGYQFRNYFHDPEDSTSLPYFIINKICVDRVNTVWIFSTSDKLSRYIRSSDQFVNIHAASDPVLKITGIEFIEINNNGDLLVAGRGGLARYDVSKGLFKQILLIGENHEILKKQEIKSFSFDNFGNIWVIINNKCLKGRFLSRDSLDFVQITGSYSFFTSERINDPMGLIYHRQFLITKDSFPWLISNVGSRRADVTKAEPVESVWNQPVDVDFYDQKTYWYKFGNSIRIFYQYGQIADIPLEPQEFPQTVFVDQDGDIWYSTISSAGLNSGLHRYCRTPDYFMHYLTETNAKPTVVYSIAKDKYGNMLAGTQGTSHVTGLDPEGILFQMNTLSKTEVESSRYPRSIFTTVNGIWIGYMNQRLDYLDYHSGEISNIFLSDYFHHREQPYGFRTLYVDSRGNLLVGTIGIYLYTPEKEKSFKKLWKSNPDGLNVYCIKEDSSGTIWAGTSNRLIKLNKDYIIDTVYTVSKNEYNVEDIIFGQKGKIWLALLGGGLELFDTETGQGEFFTTANGLSNNNTYSILKDLQGNLWISTDNGLTRFNTSTHQCRIFGPAEGLKIHEFNADAAFADQHGKMFFGGIGGIVSFYPDSIREENHEEKVYPLLITEFKVSGIPRYFDKALYELSSVTLFHGDDNIEISFACMNFRNADKLRYRYRLKGYKDAWTETDALHRSVIFTGLLPKKYILELEATNMNGDWSVNMQLRITIPPFYYQTVWFKTIMGLLIAVFMGAIVVLYNHQIRLKEKQKQDWLKLESLRGQMNPHFVFNSLNSINYFISRSDKLSANRYIADFSKLIRSMLTNLSRDYIRLTDEIESIEEYLGLEFLRFGDKFTYELKVDKKVNTDIILVFPGLIQPFIENAIWHGVRGLEGRKGHVLIEFRLKEPEHLECLVEDDGIGRCLSEKRKSQLIKRKSRGIDIIRERLKIINNLKKTTYKMTIVDRYADREESGTRVMVDIPSKFPN